MGTAAILPHKYIGAVMVGQGFSGISMNVVKWCEFGIKNLYVSALILLFISAALLFGCSSVYDTLINHKFYIESVALNLAKSEIPVNKSNFDSIKELENQNSIIGEKTWKEKLRRIDGAKLMLISVLFCFIVSFLLFPGIFMLFNFSFTPVKPGPTVGAGDIPINLGTILTLFNFGDLSGRTLGSRFHLPEKVIAVLSLLRILFWPLTFFIVTHNATVHDIVKILTVYFVGVSNGYVST